jgi:hypothetical protein
MTPGEKIDTAGNAYPGIGSHAPTLAGIPRRFIRRPGSDLNNFSPFAQIFSSKMNLFPTLMIKLDLFWQFSPT